MKTMHLLSLGCIVAALSLAAAPVDAKPKKGGTSTTSSRAESSGEEHSGFFSRTFWGFGYGRAICSVTSDVYAHGFAMGHDIAIGGSPIRNLAITFNLFGADQLYMKSEPVGGTGMLFSLAAGVGITYHFMPVNIYLAGAFGVGFHAYGTWDTFDFDVSYPGFAMEFLVGKEWWTSKDWGVGIALQLVYMHLWDEDIFGNGFRWNDVSILFGMTATFN
jgi:hypothetical protein